MEDKEIDFLVGEYLRFWGELGIEDLEARAAEVRALAHRVIAADVAPSVVAACAPSLESLRRELGTTCQNPTCRRAHKPVFGTGNPRAALMFVGDAPGAEEDQSGLPFVGPDGQLLTKIIEAMGYTRDQVYLTYAARCQPEASEIERSAPLLRAQVAAVNPRCVVTLGPVSTSAFLGAPSSPTQLHGRWQKCPWSPGLAVMPTLSPAHLLRQAADKKTVWEDMKKVKALLEAKA